MARMCFSLYMANPYKENRTASFKSKKYAM